MVKIKAQLTIQYLASFIFFIGIVVLIYISYSANIPRFVEEVNKENTRSKAYQLSEILINDPGQPANWNDSSVSKDQIKRIGLSDHSTNKTNLILKSKIDKFDSTFNCDTNFKEVQDRLALNRSFSIFIFNITENGNRDLLFSCSSPVFPKTVINATVKRITALNNNGKIELAEIIVQM
ncbi:MAG: hypothetical protein NTW30_01535 [Candidatus Aenigmarchaeota archaeon]|nr:hypothetical protein [Candidatus Aenigmarchaeota archaeon]